MSDVSVPLLEVIYWTVGGILVGAFSGYQLRVIMEARAAARLAATRVVEVEHFLEGHQEWNGNDRRAKDYEHEAGKLSIPELLLVVLFLVALTSSLFGVVVARDAQQSAQCYTELNSEFAEVLEIRASNAGELERRAQEIDRTALDKLIFTTENSFTDESVDLNSAFENYQETRVESDELRDTANSIRDQNPYPNKKRCL